MRGLVLKGGAAVAGVAIVLTFFVYIVYLITPPAYSLPVSCYDPTPPPACGSCPGGGCGGSCGQCQTCSYDTCPSCSPVSGTACDAGTGPNTGVCDVGLCVTCDCQWYDKVDVYIAYEKETTDAGDIYVARSIDNGENFDIIRKVNSDVTSTAQENPDLATAPNGNVYVVWEDNRAGTRDIYFSKSTDRGNSYPSNILLHSVTAGSQSSPSIAVHPTDSNRIYVVWDDDSTSHIYFASSTNGGTAWAAAKAITTSGNSKQFPDIAVDSAGRIYVVYNRMGGGDWDIYMVKSLDEGQTFLAEVVVSDKGANLLRPAVAVTGNGELHVIFDDKSWAGSSENRPDPTYKRSVDQGNTWTADVRINDDQPGEQKNAEIAGYNNNVYAVFDDNKAGGAKNDIIFDKTPPFTGNWNADSILNDDQSGDQQNPTIAADHQGLLYSAWVDNRLGSGNDIYTARSRNLGTVWGDNRRIDDSDVSIPDNEDKYPRPVIDAGPILCGSSQCGGVTCGAFAKCERFICDAASCTESGTSHGTEQCTATTFCDPNPPITAISRTDALAWTDWSFVDVGFTLSCDDTAQGVGCDDTYYKIVNEGEICAAGPVGYTLGAAGTVTCPANSACRKEVCYYSTDLLGNTEAPKKSNAFLIDKKTPLTTIVPDGSAWTRIPVSFTLTCSDGAAGQGSGCDRTYYKLIDDGQACGAAGFSAGPLGGGAADTADCAGGGPVCERRICYYSVDKAKPTPNTETTRTSNVFQIDKQAPVTIITLNPALPDGWNGWYTMDVLVTLTCNDLPGSGCTETRYCIDQTNTCSPTTIYTVPFSLAAEGIRYVRYFSSDNAGNVEGTVSQQVKIDKTDPALDTNSLALSGCAATDLTDPNNKICWVYGGESLTFTARHTDSVSNPNWQNLTLTNACDPGTCGCSENVICANEKEIRSSLDVDTAVFRDMIQDGSYLNIQSAACSAAPCADPSTAAKADWTVTTNPAPPADRSYTVWTLMYDEAGNTIGYDYAKWKINVRVSSGPLVSVTGAPADWTNQNAVAGVSCQKQAPPDPDCDPGTERLRLYDSNPGSCSQVYADYTVTVPRTITNYTWVCATQRDTSGAAGFSNPTEFRIEKTLPASIENTIIPRFEVLPGYFWVNQTFFNVSWFGSDDLSGIDTFQVQYKEELSGSVIIDWKDWFLSTKETSSIFAQGRDNYTYTFRVRAKDKAGNYDDYFEKELPARQVNEPAFSVNNGANMAGNILLLHLNEPAGSTNFEDVSGNRNHGVCSGSACPLGAGDGKINNSLHYDGLDDSIDIFNFNNLPNQRITVSAWINVTLHEDWNRVLNHEWVNNGWLLYTNAIGDVIFGVAQAGVQYNAQGNISLGIGTWYHVAGVYDGSTVKVFVNGQFAGSRALAAATMDTDGTVEVGGKGGTQFFNGMLDEVAIWNRSLSDEEIIDIYRRGMDRLYVTVDITDPICIMAPLPQYSRNLDFRLVWSVAGEGSGLKHSQINYQRDALCGGGPFPAASFDTPVAGLNFYANGVDGCTYSFRCNATDSVNNDGPYSPFVTLTIDNTTPVSSVSKLPEWINKTSWNVSWAASDEVSGIDCVEVRYMVTEGKQQRLIQDWTLWELDGPGLTCTDKTSAIFGPAEPTGVSNNRTYHFMSRSMDNAGHVEAWPFENDTNTTVDTIRPVINITAYDQNGDRIAPPSIVVSAQEVSSVKIVLNSTDTISGIKSNRIRVFITEPAGERYEETECGPAEPYGGGTDTGDSVCSATYAFGEETSIKYWAEATDRANNTNVTGTTFIVTHGLANFVNKNINMIVGDRALNKVQVRNLQEQADTVTVTLYDYHHATFIDSEILAAGGTISADKRTITVSLNPDEDAEFNVRIISSEPGEYHLNLTASSAISTLTDDDSTRITISFSAGFSEINEWAIGLLVILALFIFHKFILRKE